jgi:branched-chain amino acid transport system substrate-binding protein
MTKEGVFALGFFVGTPTAKVYVPVAREEEIPVVGLFTGAQMLYAPFKRCVINMRAFNYDETRKQVDKLWDLNVRKIALIYQDDALGKAVLDGVKLALAEHNSTPVAPGTFACNTLDVGEGMSVMAAHPHAVVVVAPYAPVAGIVKKARAAGWRPQFLALSSELKNLSRKPGPMRTARLLPRSFLLTIAPIIRRLRSIASICRSIIGTQRRVM